MSEIRTKIAAGATLLALGGLSGLALSHPQAPVPATQIQTAAAKHLEKQTPMPAILSKDDRFEGGGADD